jgi:hypothetical protein
MSTRVRATSPRAGALIAAGSVVVHEGRHIMCGQAELGMFGPLVAVALALAAGSWIASSERATTWRSMTVALMAIFLVQESFEVVRDGGTIDRGAWIALPLAVVIGGLIALVLRGARAVEGGIRPWSPVAFESSPARQVTLPLVADVRRLAPLARLLAGRAPPLAS